MISSESVCAVRKYEEWGQLQQHIFHGNTYMYHRFIDCYQGDGRLC